MPLVRRHGGCRVWVRAWPRFFTEACGVVRPWLAWCGLGELGTSDGDQRIGRSAGLGVVSLGQCGIVTVLDAG